jgi:hypothetical protein
MLDNDLSELYLVETKRLNEQVKRNIKRFPEDFMFQLTIEEWENLKSQNATSSWGGRRIPPYAFTEHGILMLSSVLNSDRAIAVNIQVMRVFTRMRELLQNNQNIMNKLMEMEGKGAKRDESISLIFDYLRQLEHEKQQVENQRNRKKIGLKKKSKITTFLQYPTTHNQTVKQILQQKNPDPL